LSSLSSETCELKGHAVNCFYPYLFITRPFTGQHTIKQRSARFVSVDILGRRRSQAAARAEIATTAKEAGASTLTSPARTDLRERKVSGFGESPMESYRATANEAAQAHGWGRVLPERVPSNDLESATANC